MTFDAALQQLKNNPGAKINRPGWKDKWLENRAEHLPMLSEVDGNGAAKPWHPPSRVRVVECGASDWMVMLVAKAVEAPEESGVHWP